MKWLRKSYRNPEIDPDEIFLDASVSTDFDRGRFEGRIEKPLAPSAFVSLGIVLALLFITLAGRAWHLQFVNGEAFAAESAHNSLEAVVQFAPRGVITDKDSVVLVDNVVRDDGTMGRNYLYPEIGQIVGYVSYPKKDKNGNYYDTAMRGVAGLEAEYDALLSGTNGQLLTETDAVGTVRSSGIIVPAKEGKTLRLTIDATMERSLARAIAATATSRHFNAGAGVIIDIHTGAIRALVSYPSYDPNVMSNGGPSSIIASYNTSPGHPYLDHAVQGIYAPGSTVKPFVAAGALTDGLITPQTIINDPGQLLVPDPYHPGKNFVYKGWRALGLMDVRHAIAWSSDAFFYTLGGGFGSQKGLGIDRLNYWYDAFGIGKPTGVNLPEEAAGVIPTPAWKQKVFNEQWYLGDTYFTAIGQYSMQVTPIQMARATAAVANGGTLYKPTLLEGEPPVATPVPVDPDALRVVREGMRIGVTNALSAAINLPYISAAAKTGTAQVGVHNEYDNSWVEGFFPYENPQYAFAVVLERGPSGTGEEAVNVMRQFFERVYGPGSKTQAETATTTP